MWTLTQIWKLRPRRRSTKALLEKRCPSRNGQRPTKQRFSVKKSDIFEASKHTAASALLSLAHYRRSVWNIIFLVVPLRSWHTLETYSPVPLKAHFLEYALHLHIFHNFKFVPYWANLKGTTQQVSHFLEIYVGNGTLRNPIGLARVASPRLCAVHTPMELWI